MNVSTVAVPCAPTWAATACGWTVMSSGDASTRASSRRLPPQRILVTSAPLAETQLAARGRSSSAATCASTSFPRSVPGPMTAVAPSRRASSAMASAIARGAYAAKASCIAACSDLDAVAGELVGRSLCRITTGAYRLHRCVACEGAGKRHSLERRLVDGAVGVLEVDEHHHRVAPARWKPSEAQRGRGRAGRRLTRAPRSRAGPRPHGVRRRLPRRESLPASPRPRHDESHELETRRGPYRRARLDRLALRAQASRHRRVPRQVEPFLHRHDGRKREHVDVASTRRLLLAAHGAAVERQRLQAGRDRPAERVGHADPDLEVA